MKRAEIIKRLTNMGYRIEDPTWHNQKLLNDFVAAMDGYASVTDTGLRDAWRWFERGWLSARSRLN